MKLYYLLSGNDNSFNFSYGSICIPDSHKIYSGSNIRNVDIARHVFIYFDKFAGKFMAQIFVLQAMAKS